MFILHKYAAIILSVFAVVSPDEDNTHYHSHEVLWVIPWLLDIASSWIVPIMCLTETHWYIFLIFMSLFFNIDSYVLSTKISLLNM